jgi:hypothetical protein
VVIPDSGEDYTSLSLWNLTLRCSFFLVGRFISGKILQKLFGHQLHRFRVNKGSSIFLLCDAVTYS